MFNKLIDWSVQDLKQSMIMKKVLGALLIVTVFTVSSCTLGLLEKEVSPLGVIEKVYDLDEFDEIRYGNAFNVQIVPSTQFKVTAEGDERDIDDLDVRVERDVLKIDYLKNGWFSGNKRYRMDLIIEVPSFTELDASGASDTEVEEFTNLSDVRLEVSGASKLRFKSGIDNLNADVSGASTLNLYKAVNIFEGEISGASKLNAVEESISEVILRLSGASRATVDVTDVLDVDASGASTVRYRGNPDVKERTSGASKVVKD